MLLMFCNTGCWVVLWGVEDYQMNKRQFPCPRPRVTAHVIVLTQEMLVGIGCMLVCHLDDSPSVQPPIESHPSETPLAMIAL